MQAIILAAGLGTRMGELTRQTPKPLLKVREETILQHNLAAMPDAIDEVIIVVGYLKEQIAQAIGSRFGSRKVAYVHQAELKGTAHALSLCKDALHGRFLVLMGDDLYSKGDLALLIKEPLAILVWEMKNDERMGERQALVSVNAQGGVIHILERQPAAKGALVNAGAYVLDMRLFDYPLVAAGIPAGEFGLPQTFLQMIKNGALMSVVKAIEWRKISAPEDLSPEHMV